MANVPIGNLMVIIGLSGAYIWLCFPGRLIEDRIPKCPGRRIEVYTRVGYITGQGNRERDCVSLENQC